MKGNGRALARNILIVCAIVVAALAVRGMAGSMKKTFHIDEGYSAALTNGEWVPGTDTAEHDKWIRSDDLFSVSFVDHLAAEGKADFARITEATGLDIHPPLYYWLFSVARRTFGVDRFAFAGYALNMILFALSCLIFTLVARRIWRDWPTVFFALIIFAFSSTAISLTIFIRMYELLQLLCLAFFALAVFVVSPSEGKNAKPVALACAFAGLFAVSFLGLMTQYYFLFFIAPVAACAFVFLVLKKRFSSILWSVLAVGAGLYLAYRLFPEMKEHLTVSYRAAQSFENLAKTGNAQKAANLWAYLKILSANLVPAIAIAAVAILAIVERVRKVAVPGRHERSPVELAAFIMALSAFVVTFMIVSISAPYQTARYIGSFFPVYALAFVGFVRLVLTPRAARIMLGASAILVFAHGIIPSNICEFHEDYQLDKDPYYMTDSKPVIIFASPEGGSWKNILPYLNIGKGKKVYVGSAEMKNSIAKPLMEIAKSSGEKEVYAIVDDYISKQPPFEKIGYYAFYYVYRIRVE